MLTKTYTHTYTHTTHNEHTHKDYREDTCPGKTHGWVKPKQMRV